MFTQIDVSLYVLITIFLPFFCRSNYIRNCWNISNIMQTFFILMKQKKHQKHQQNEVIISFKFSELVIMILLLSSTRFVCRYVIMAHEYNMLLMLHIVL